MEWQQPSTTSYSGSDFLFLVLMCCWFHFCPTHGHRRTISRLPTCVRLLHRVNGCMYVVRGEERNSQVSDRPSTGAVEACRDVVQVAVRQVAPDERSDSRQTEINRTKCRVQRRAVPLANGAASNGLCGELFYGLARNCQIVPWDWDEYDEGLRSASDI